MKVRTATQRPILWLFVLLALVGCKSKQAANQAVLTSGNEKLTVRPEKPVFEAIEDSNTPSAVRLVADYDARDFGSPGWRRVRMELITDGAVTQAFTVVNLWRNAGKRVQTLFLLEEPKALSGTNYLLQESEDTIPDMAVHLFLPAGEGRVLEVAPNNFDEGLLGSDFAYNDVRMRLPLQGFSYRVVGRSRLRNQATWVLEAEPTSEKTRQSCRWKRARFYLARDFNFLLGADYFGDSKDKGNALPFKQMRVESFEQINTVWTATRIIMFRSDSRSTVLTLKDAGFTVPDFNPRLFAAAELPSLADKVRKGWLPDGTQTPKQ